MSNISRKLIGGIILITVLATGSYFWYAFEREKQALYDEYERQTSVECPGIVYADGTAEIDPKCKAEIYNKRMGSGYGGSTQSMETAESVKKMLADVPKDHPLWQVAYLISSTEELTPLIHVDTSDWVPYRNAEMGFTSKLPQGWYGDYVDNHKNIQFTSYNKQQQPLHVSIGIEENKNTLSLERFIRDRGPLHLMRLQDSTLVLFFEKYAVFFSPDSETGFFASFEDQDMGIDYAEESFPGIKDVFYGLLKNFSFTKKE